MRFDHYQSGLLYGIRYAFKAGERLWPHEHAGETADQVHNIIVLAGTVVFKDPDGSLILTTGTVHDFDGSRPHSIYAPEPAVILNLMLYGKPASFDDYSEDQKHGEA